VPIDHDDYEQRATRINLMLEELRLNTEDLHELAKQATDRTWESIRAAQNDAQPSRKTRRAL
jgi:hypothetical protein